MTAPRFDQAPLASGDSLLLALFVAALLHVVILLGIHFRAPEAPKVTNSIEVTLSHAPLKKAPKTAKYLAADHQLGAGEETSKPQPLQQNLPLQAQIPAPAPIEKHDTTKPLSPSPKKPTPQKLLTQAHAATKIATPKQVIEDEPNAVPEENKPRLNAEVLQQQITQLGEQIRTRQKSAENSRIKNIESVSTHKYIAANYVQSLTEKIQRTGQSNVPKSFRKEASLTMEIGIKSDGTLYSMRITRSSGNPALDEEAKRIVSISAPFAAFPAELRKESDVYTITRTVKFHDETGMTAR